MSQRVYIQNVRKNSYKFLKVDPIAGALGAEISGVDLRKPLTDAVFDEIHAAFLENLVVFITGQDLMPQHQCNFARRFGTLTKHPFLKTLDEYPEVLRLVREADQNVQVIGRRWHSDSTFLETPPMGSSLYCQESPPYGGDTLFCNLYLAYDILSEGMRRLAESLIMVHSGEAYAPTEDKGVSAAGAGAGLTVIPSAQAAIEREHPLVRTHPETGRDALWMPGLDYGRRFRGMSREESMPLMQYFQSVATQELLSCRYRWKKGTLVLWDNRCVQHLALDDYLGFRREMYRVEIAGDRPFGPALPKQTARTAASPNLSKAG